MFGNSEAWNVIIVTGGATINTENMPDSGFNNPLLASIAQALRPVNNMLKSGISSVGESTKNMAVSYAVEFVVNQLIDLLSKNNTLFPAEKDRLEKILTSIKNNKGDYSILSELPYVPDQNRYKNIVGAGLAHAPMPFVNYVASYVPLVSLAGAIYKYSKINNNPPSRVAFMYITLFGLLKYLEYFPPVIFSVSKVLAIDKIKKLWQSSFIFAKLLDKFDEDRFKADVKKALQQLLQQGNLQPDRTVNTVQQPKPNVLDLTHEDGFTVTSVSLEDDDTQTPSIDTFILQVQREYTRSLALQMHADQESKRVLYLTKSLLCMLAIGAPGSKESCAFEATNAILLSLLSGLVRNFILTNGNKEVSAVDRIHNAKKIAQNRKIDLMPPSSQELLMQASSLPRPEMTILLEKTVNSFSLTKQLTICLTWAYKTANSNKGLLLAATAPLIFGGLLSKNIIKLPQRPSLVISSSPI